MSNYEQLEHHIEQIKEDYLFGVVDDEGVTQFFSVKKLADNYNVSFNTLRKVASKEKWSKQKKDISSKIQEKVHDKKSDYAAESIVQNDIKFKETGLKARRLIDKKYDVIEKRLKNNQHVPAREFKDLGDALKSNYEIVKIAEGENPDDNIANGLDNLAIALQTSRQKNKKKS